MTIQLNGDTGITTPMYNGTISANAVTPSVSMKNRLINSAMVIDQRNAGASLAVTSSWAYCVDRFTSRATTGSGHTVQQSSTVPAGFTKSLKFTVGTGASVGSTDVNGIQQIIEGYNVADLGWGTANAKTITLSAWVYSSLTGTFGGSLKNDNADRSYPFQYTISSANTWTQISVTIAGDTSGTWATTNAGGLYVTFGLGVGSTYTAASGSWAAGNYLSANSSVNVVATSGATFYITGVQLEVGSSATSFDYRQYGQELALCQRYYFQITPNGTQYSAYASGYAAGTTDINLIFKYPVPPRTSCTGITASSAASWIVQQSGGNLFNPTITFVRANQTNITIDAALSGATGGGGATLIDGNNASYIYFNGMEL